MTTKETDIPIDEWVSGLEPKPDFSRAFPPEATEAPDPFLPNQEPDAIIPPKDQFGVTDPKAMKDNFLKGPHTTDRTPRRPNKKANRQGFKMQVAKPAKAASISLTKARADALAKKAEAHNKLEAAGLLDDLYVEGGRKSRVNYRPLGISFLAKDYKSAKAAVKFVEEIVTHLRNEMRDANK